jgi:hypothetical protein
LIALGSILFFLVVFALDGFVLGECNYKSKKRGSIAPVARDCDRAEMAIFNRKGKGGTLFFAAAQHRFVSFVRSRSLDSRPPAGSRILFALHKDRL